MKAIMMSIRPEWVAKILNGEKTIEIRKKFPKDYVGWVYVYVTSHKNYTQSLYEVETYKKKRKWDVDYYIPSEPGFILNGKVVARFWCDKVEEIKCIHNEFAIERYITDTLNIGELMVESCVSFQQIQKYLYYSNGYAIHITKVKPFDKSKEISEFYNKRERMFVNGKMLYDHKFYLICAPQSWCYVEI